MVTRIKQLIMELGLSTRAFAINCGLRQNTLSNQLNGMRDLSLQTVSAILESYPQISADWLMRGKGQMFIQNVDNTFENEKVNKQDDLITILMDTIKSKNDMIGTLTERIKQLEQTNLK